MSSVRVILPDLSEKQFDHSPSILEVAESIGPRLAKETLGGIVNDGAEVQDLRSRLSDGDRLRIITSKDPEALEVIRHSAAHVMAQAVQEIWPEVKVTIGPVIDNGFYYDFDAPFAFTPEDLTRIEKKMNEILKRNLNVEKKDLSSQEAIQTFKSIGEDYKIEIIEDLGVDQVSVYSQGEWFDLCRGPHVQRLGQIKAIKVLSLAGAYWRGDEKRAQLQRVYATAFFSQKDLDEHLAQLEEAKKRDHRKLGRELGLFYFDQMSPGGPFFSPKGTIVYNELLGFIRDQYKKFGYSEVITPQVFDVDLFHQSGHYDNYRDNMYFMQVDERPFSLKPMNCPGHCVLYRQERKSYRDLPWRVADFGRLHRYERSGVMHGLTRVRSFCQDDAHVFCRMDQMQSEIQSVMQMIESIYSVLGMTEYQVFLSTRPEKSMGSDEVWERAESALSSALKQLNIPYKINPGDGAFYGPKLDIMFVDALKRPWQLGTVQLDFNLPQAFELSFVGEDNSAHQPVMIHRAILGSLERFIGVYLEHTNAHLPTWLAPTQVALLSVTDRSSELAKELHAELQSRSIRVFNDERNEKLGFKIREAQLQKIPYMVILGDKEVESNTITLRNRLGHQMSGISRSQFLTAIEKEIGQRSLELSLTQVESTAGSSV